MKLLLVPVVLLSSLALNAQTTWKGLKFGMSRDETKKVLAEYDLQPNENKDLVSRTDYVLNPPQMDANWPFKIRLQFNPAGKLNIVLLELDSDKEIADKRTTNRESAVGVTAGMLLSVFTDKYGNPIKSQGQVRGIRSFCSKSWSTTGQSVSLFWSFDGPPMDTKLFIQYTVTPDDI